MSIPRQIGEGPDVQILKQILKQLERLTKIVGTTTITTTTAP